MLAIKYDVVVYGVRNNIIKYLELSELVSVKGKTQNVLLPKEASYASVIVRNVNNQEIPYDDPIKHVPFLNRAIYAVATIVLTVVIGLLWWAYFNNIMTILDESSGISALLSFVVSAIVGALLAGLGLLFYKMKRTFRE